MNGPTPLQAAKQRILSHYPRFSPILLRLDIQVIPNSREAFITRDWRVGMGDRNLLDAAVGAGTIMHEMFHGLLDHFNRKGDRDHDRWNAATDIVINETLLSLFGTNSKFKTEADWLFARTFGLHFVTIPTAEQVYEMLPEGAGVSRQCGSGAGSPNGLEDSLAPRTSDFTWEHKQAAINQTMIELMSPGGWGSGSKEMSIWKGLKPRKVRVKWQEHLAHSVGIEIASQLGRNRQLDWRRANRRGAELPGSQTFSPNITLVVDTSGSMGSVGHIVLGQVTSLLEDLGSVRVVTCDTQITSDRVIAGVDDLEGLGGGGTNLTAALDSAQDGVIVCITDGEMTRPTCEVQDVIWVLTGNGRQPWMNKVVVYEEVN